MESNFGAFRVRQTPLSNGFIEIMVFDHRIYDSVWYREITKSQLTWALSFLATHQMPGAHWELYELLATATG